MMVLENTVTNCPLGIGVNGAARGVLVAGNRVSGSALGGLQLALLIGEAGDILVANNSVVDCRAAFRLWDGEVRGERIEIAGNLFLGSSGPDMVYIDSGGTVFEVKGPGDGRLLEQRWNLRNNWREGRKPDGDDVLARSWAPPAAGDALVESIQVLSREPASADFLRPPAGSPLAAGGAGAEDPALPRWAGALPPPGEAAWDWQRTWDARHPKKLITISKEPSGGGDCRSLAEALEKARAGMTIRFLDDAVYREEVAIQRADLHAGITIEGPRGAILEPVNRIAINILNVPRVAIRSLRIRGKVGAYSICVYGRSPGVLLEKLHFERRESADFTAVSIDALKFPETEEPVMVRGCTIRGASKGIRISGMLNDYKTPDSCGRIALLENVIDDVLQPIIVYGSAHDIVIAGNRIGGCVFAGIQLENLLAGARDILIANNTVISCRHPFRLWDDGVKGDGIELRNNLFLGSTGPDLVFIDSGGDPMKMNGPGDGGAVMKAWRWGGNWREGAPPAAEGIEEKSWIPVAPGDVLQPSIAVRSRDPKDPDYLRQPEGSPLANSGAEDPTLPPYVGAIPPAGVPPWNWLETLEARARRAAAR
jgi:hypothetical protein